MIQFFIENQEVILPDDFSFTQIDENPLITNNGEFTLDITVSLRNGKNAKAAKFINRINKIDIDTSYNALMIDDGKYKHGTIIIQSHTNIDMTFQFVAGNSELNYNAKADNRKIWELNWGSRESMTSANALKSINFAGYGFAPGFNQGFNTFVCAPVSDGKTIYNDYDIELISANSLDRKLTVKNIIMQPYLMYYVEMLPELLGYTLAYNVLEYNQRAKMMYLVNVVDSLNFADALPDMSITEFIQAIENFFNVTFFVDMKNKTMSIITMSASLDSKKTFPLKRVLNEYKREFVTDDNSNVINFSRLAYDLGSAGIFKYQRISDSTFANCEIKKYADMNLLIAYISGTTELISDKRIIYQDTSTDNDFFVIKTGSELYPGINLYRRKIHNANQSADFEIILINKLKPTSEDSSNEFQLKIVPAEIIRIQKSCIFRYLASPGNYYDFGGNYFFQAPKSSDAYFINKNLGFVESVETGEQSIPRKSQLEVAMYSGKIFVHSEEGMYYPGNFIQVRLDISYPMSHIDLYPEFGYGDKTSDADEFESYFVADFVSTVETTMRLAGVNGILSEYRQEKVYDDSIVYEFEMPDAKELISDNLFEYNGMTFIPISLERTKSREKGVVKGTFYRML